MPRPSTPAVPISLGLMQSMPKVELHLHLEGAIPLDTMWLLVQRHDHEGEVPGPEALIERFRYTDFAHFLQTWAWKLRFHRSYEDYELIGEAVARDLVRQNIVYAEAFVSPSDAFGHGLETAPLLMAVRRGIDRVEGVDIALVPDLVRNTGPERALHTLGELLEVRDDAGVIGITIGGSEAGYPAGLFVDAYARAAAAGLGLTAHAGEGAGPESVWAAVSDLGVHRIGHGVRAVEDPGLVAWLVVNRLPLEVCPTSNLRTGVAESWETHPVRTLVDVGAMVTINSDDPAMFDCSVAGEYLALSEEYGYRLDVIVDLARNSIDASWASGSRKETLHTQLDHWVATAGRQAAQSDPLDS
jgi:adenosine deaminase